MKTDCFLARLCQTIILPLLCVVFTSCTHETNDTGDIENLIRRYNHLLIQGYQKQDMNPIQEVATEEHARKLYHHMSALGEGKLRMESKLKGITFKKTDLRSSDEATVETEETWDFTQYRMDKNEKHAEEKDFIYRMGYILNKKDGRWMITRVNTISGTSTNSVIPFPQLDRKGNKVSLSQNSSKPANHP